MALTIEEVREIATLARLRFTPEEERRATEHLDQIVTYVNRLAACAGTEGAARSIGLREDADAIAPGLPRERFLGNAPEARDGFLVVPEVKTSESETS